MKTALLLSLAFSSIVHAQSFKDANGQPCTNLTTARIQVLKKIGDKTYSVIVGGFMAPRQNMVLKTTITDLESSGVVPFSLPIFVEVDTKKMKVDMVDGFTKEFPLATETKECHDAGVIALEKQRKEKADQEQVEREIAEEQQQKRQKEDAAVKTKEKNRKKRNRSLYE